MSSRRTVPFGQVPLSRLLSIGGMHFRHLYITSSLLWSVVYGLPLLIGALIALLLDRAGGHPMPPAVWRLLALVVGLMILRALTLPFALQLTFKLIFQMSSWIKMHILTRLLEQPSRALPTFGTGELLNRLRDDSDEIGGLLEWTTDLIYRFALAVVAIAVLLINDIVLTIPLLLLLGCGLAASAALKKRVVLLKTETRVRQGSIGATITDTLMGIRDLRLGAVLGDRLAALERRFAERRRFQVSYQLYSDLLSDLFRNLVVIATAVILLTMSLSENHARFTVGRLLLFVTYSSWLGQQMYFFGRMLARYQAGLVSYRRLTELALPGLGSKLRHERALSPIHRSEDIESPHTKTFSSQPVSESLQTLRVIELTCSAAHVINAPAPVTFEVERGQTVVLTGQIGAGKSTLIRSLLGLQPKVSGHVYWNELDVTGQEVFFRSPRVAYTCQVPRFLQGTVRDNLVLGTTSLCDEYLNDVLTAVELRPGSLELPRGLDTFVDSSVAANLSGGQRQRLALARMLCRAAELYIVDDCDSSLDSATAKKIWLTLPSRWPAAWIAVSHNSDLIAAADKVVTIRRTEAVSMA